MSVLPVFGNRGQVPASIGGLNLIDVVQYENPGMGAAFKYGFPPILTADAYLYNNGITNIPDDLRSRFFADSFRQQHQGILMMENVGTIRDVEVLQSSVLAHPNDRNTPLCFWSSFAYRHIQREVRYREDAGVARDGKGNISDVGRVISHLTMRPDRGYFNKVRFTYVERASDPAYFGVTAKDVPDPALHWFLKFVSQWTYAVQTAPIAP